jgi:hypothetical protein
MQFCGQCIIQPFIHLKMFSLDPQYKISLKSVSSLEMKHMDRYSAPVWIHSVHLVQWTHNKSCITCSNYFTYMVCLMFHLLHTFLKTLAYASCEPLKYFREKISLKHRTLFMVHKYMYTHAETELLTTRITRERHLPGQAWAGVGITIAPTDWDMVWWAVARQTGICRVQAPQWCYFTLLLPARDLTSITAAYVAVYVEPHTMLCNRHIGISAVNFHYWNSPYFVLYVPWT